MAKGKQKEREAVFISEADQFVFAQGSHYDIYKKLGAHLSYEDGKEGVFFGVWAPHAKEVFVVGDFNEWQEGATPMLRIGEGGIHTAFVPEIGIGELYKFLIVTEDGRRLYKADPFANYAQLRPETASVVTDLTGYKWTDSVWMKEREKKDVQKLPLSVYECHIGSWMKHPDGKEGFYNYRE